MSRETPISVSSESDSPIAVTITSNSESAQTIPSDRNPDVALVSEIITAPEEDDQRSDTIEHVDSDSDDREVLEAEVETARARREEREALEKLAKARRARGSNAPARSVRSSRSVRSVISSETFAARRAASVLTSQPALLAPPALPTPRHCRSRGPRRSLSTSPSSRPLSLTGWSGLLRVPRERTALFPVKRFMPDRSTVPITAKGFKGSLLSVNGSFNQSARVFRSLRV